MIFLYTLFLVGFFLMEWLAFMIFMNFKQLLLNVLISYYDHKLL